MTELPQWHEDLIRMSTGIDPRAAGAIAGVAGDVARLAGMFNKAQHVPVRGSKMYLSDAALRNAYFIYYTTANMLKLAAPLDALRCSASAAGRAGVQVSVLDLGCGTGTCMLGLLAWNESRHNAPGPVSYHASDSVTEAAVFVESLAADMRRLRPDMPLTVTTSVNDLMRPTTLGRQFDLIFLSNVLSEMPGRDPERLSAFLIEHLAADGSVVIIEPALRETSRAALEFRDALLASGWTVFAPCFRQGRCPALDDERDWCHHDLPWRRPAWMQVIDDRIGHLKLSLKFTYLVLNRHGETLLDSLRPAMTPFRVVSERFDEKGRTRAILCGEEGRRPFLLNTRDAGASNDAFRSAGRYDILTIDGYESRTHRAPPPVRCGVGHG